MKEAAWNKQHYHGDRHDDMTINIVLCLGKRCCRHVADSA